MVLQKNSRVESKAASLSSFGIAPHFRSLLKAKIRASDKYVLLFDESLNDNLQKKQVDIHIRFWDGDEVGSRYFDSQFLGHATASDLHTCLQKSCEEAGTHGIFQLSMDGAAVNWKVYDMLTENIEQETGSKLLNIGSCGLHVMHNAFKAGSAKTKWGVEQTFSCLFWLIKDSPARREDYSKVTGSNVFPKLYCQHRWLENLPVTERAIEIWPHVQKYVASVRAKQIPEPKSKSFFVVAESCDDPLFVTKANIFLSIAKEFQPLLEKYQTDMPVLPYFGQDLFKLITDLMDRFIKDDVMEQVTSADKLFSVDVTDCGNHKEAAQVNLGFVADRMLKEKVSEKQVLAIRSNTKTFVQAEVAKLLEKCPLLYSLVRNLGWVDPTQIVLVCLEHLVSAKQMKEGNCDDILKQFSDFSTYCRADEEFVTYDPQSRLDCLM